MIPDSTNYGPKMLQVNRYEISKHYDVAINFVNNKNRMKIMSYIFFKHAYGTNRLIKQS
jgi:hypothetical protein